VHIVVLDATVTLGNGAGDVVESRVSAPGSITLGNGNNDLFNLDDFARASGSTITLGNGNNDLVNLGLGLLPFNVGNTISLGNGNNDTVMASTFVGDTITVGNGNDTLFLGKNDSSATTVANRRTTSDWNSASERSLSTATIVQSLSSNRRTPSLNPLHHTAFGQSVRRRPVT